MVPQVRKIVAFGWRAALGAIMVAYGLAAVSAHADESVQFPTLDGQVTLTGVLARPHREGPSPAVVMMHGCSGLGAAHGPFALYRQWRDVLFDEGYVVLMVDSATPRGFGQTCTPGEQRKRMWKERPGDAYAALAYLQKQGFVDPARVALAGWSQGGGAVLLAIPARSSGRPAPPPSRDFVAAIAFYPGACSDRLQSQPFVVDAPAHSWTTSIPLLVLQGEADNWTPAAPCQAFLHEAQERGAPVTLKLYPGAWHAFDASNVPAHTIERYRRNNWAPVTGTDDDARDDARRRVRDFLAAHLREPAKP